MEELIELGIRAVKGAGSAALGLVDVFSHAPGGESTGGGEKKDEKAEKDEKAGDGSEDGGKAEG
ncbi:hypothetical protein ACFWZ2_43370 [Streptomyces sp. NPDC059002]|uniref:hypothetical protein n=1 Tax=Streptomyces sp. NPDC059002 TaxID=3346690 RepID=UPI0036BE926F